MHEAHEASKKKEKASEGVREGLIRMLEEAKAEMRKDTALKIEDRFAAINNERSYLIKEISQQVEADLKKEIMGLTKKV